MGEKLNIVRGSGNAFLAAQAGKHITLEGQEKDVTTAGLARKVSTLAAKVDGHLQRMGEKP